MLINIKIIKIYFNKIIHTDDILKRTLFMLNYLLDIKTKSNMLLFYREREDGISKQAI